MWSIRNHKYHGNEKLLYYKIKIPHIDKNIQRWQAFAYRRHYLR